MVDSEYSPNNYKSLKISIGVVIKHPEMLRYIPDHLKTKNVCKNAVKKLPFLIECVPDQCKTQEMCDKVILENGETLIFVPGCSKY